MRNITLNIHFIDRHYSMNRINIETVSRNVVNRTAVQVKQQGFTIIPDYGRLKLHVLPFTFSIAVRLVFPSVYRFVDFAKKQKLQKNKTEQKKNHNYELNAQ